ncbi:hypothetical protein AAZX31_02G115700 [Glycine max]|uniref:Root meristem growth factor 8 n=2 Tax=Glycine subgen. Soja TaxID=1462606 RepID=I1JEK0_SOYBN|nr:uncharacterized protein LOC114370958 [Glycine soja]KAG5062893.1 hypothetical protein JHK85_004076 [Glycine max]KAG5079838.1 hypothetical protein JHK86_003903 [Glycine max]KAH1059979.1 hypothetical protein GYH30_003794 [Glycine max]KAH1261218.1 hypothetical protein GmHk_02G004130 [Glycine max]KRH70997.1 hypothetical protein GLYMA_02G122800v4 [Glycine max]
MELIIIITLLSFSFSYLIPTCSSSQIQLEPSLQLEDDNIGVNTNLQLSLPTVPRKLRFTEKVKEDDGARDLASHKQENSFAAAGKQYHRKQNMVLGKKGTRQEWMEVDDPSQYFTMDYTRVRRRRPIHNKQLPVNP